MFIWMFPLDKLQVFDTVYILTYMFEASSLCWMLQATGTEWSVHHVVSDSQGGYTLADGPCDITDWKEETRSLLHIYDGPLNLDYSLSSTWWKNSTDAEKTAVRNSMRNVL